MVRGGGYAAGNQTPAKQKGPISPPLPRETRPRRAPPRPSPLAALTPRWERGRSAAPWVLGVTRSPVTARGQKPSLHLEGSRVTQRPMTAGRGRPFPYSPRYIGNRRNLETQTLRTVGESATQRESGCLQRSPHRHGVRFPRQQHPRGALASHLPSRVREPSSGRCGTGGGTASRS